MALVMPARAGGKAVPVALVVTPVVPVVMADRAVPVVQTVAPDQVALRVLVMAPVPMVVPAPMAPVSPMSPTNHHRLLPEDLPVAPEAVRVVDLVVVPEVDPVGVLVAARVAPMAAVRPVVATILRPVFHPVKSGMRPIPVPVVSLPVQAVRN